MHGEMRQRPNSPLASSRRGAGCNPAARGREAPSQHPTLINATVTESRCPAICADSICAGRSPRAAGPRSGNRRNPAACVMKQRIDPPLHPPRRVPAVQGSVLPAAQTIAGRSTAPARRCAARPSCTSDSSRCNGSGQSRNGNGLIDRSSSSWRGPRQGQRSASWSGRSQRSKRRCAGQDLADRGSSMLRTRAQGHVKLSLPPKPSAARCHACNSSRVASAR